MSLALNCGPLPPPLQRLLEKSSCHTSARETADPHRYRLPQVREGKWSGVSVSRSYSNYLSIRDLSNLQCGVRVALSSEHWIDVTVRSVIQVELALRCEQHHSSTSLPARL